MLSSVTLSFERMTLKISSVTCGSLDLVMSNCDKSHESTSKYSGDRWENASRSAWMCDFTMTLTSDLLISKPNQFTFVRNCT